MTNISTVPTMEERLIRIVVGPRKVDLASVTPDTTLDQLGISSLDALAIVFDIEAEFGVNIPDTDIYKMKTVRDILMGVQHLLSNQSEASTS